MGKPWFRVKQYGYGAGFPCSWEGWALLAGFIGLLVVISSLAPDMAVDHPWAFTIGHIGLGVGLIWIVWRKSDKPWAWRWGQDD